MSTLPRDPSNAADAEYHAAMPVVSYEHEFEQVVHEFGRAAEALGVERPSETELRDLCLQIAAFTAVLFPGEIAFKVKNDPEFPDDLYLVFEVAATGDLDQIMARSREWHLTAHRTAGRCADLFCLSLDAR